MMRSYCYYDCFLIIIRCICTQIPNAHFIHTPADLQGRLHAIKQRYLVKSGFQGLNIACFFEITARFFEKFSKNRAVI